MPLPPIDLLYPESRSGLDRDALADLYGRPGAAGQAGPDGVWIRVNFVSTADGSATGPDDRSGTISSAADKKVFGVLRRLADVVLVGAGTVRREGYEGSLASPGQRAWRREHGFAEQPGLAIVSGSLGLDPDSPVFTEAPVRPVVLTLERAPQDRRAALAAVADVVDVGGAALEVARLRAVLAGCGWSDVLCEGGPTLLAALAAQQGVDELCVTIEPRLVAGDGPRIAHGPAADERMRLAHVLRGDEDALVLRYVRD